MSVAGYEQSIEAWRGGFRLTFNSRRDGANSALMAARVVRDLVPHYGADCPAAVIYRASW